VENLFRNIPLFSGLQEEDLKTISSHAITRSYAKNTIIINEGDLTDSMYVILSGRVKVFLSNEEGKEIVINTMGEGEYFGELAMLDKAPRSASVMTMEPCRLSMISKSHFDACLAQNPAIALKLIETLTQRIRHLTENVKNLALLDVYGRVARILLGMAKQQVDGRLVIEEKLSQQDIGKRVGASREMVGRILRALSTGGYIKNEGGRITINERLPAGW
jgi:CRP/FNR family cyclic AMP-dependent transcriptional regulator